MKAKFEWGGTGWEFKLETTDRGDIFQLWYREDGKSEWLKDDRLRLTEDGRWLKIVYSETDDYVNEFNDELNVAHQRIINQITENELLRGKTYDQ